MNKVIINIPFNTINNNFNKIFNKIYSYESAPLIFILVLPIFIFYFSTSLLLQSGWVDPYYYTGYVHNFPEMIERFGKTYYSARISFIYPERFLVWLLGSKLGYCLFRYILLTALLASAWKMARTYYSNIISALFIVMLGFNPWLLRSLYYDYCDGAGIVYSIIALQFFIGHYSNKTIPYLLSGVFFAMAANCNLFLLAMGGLFLPSYFILFWDPNNTGNVLKKIGLSILGFCWTLLILSTAFYIEFPQYNFFIESATINMATFDKQGRLHEYWSPFKEIFLNSGHGLALFFPLYIFSISILYFSLTFHFRSSRMKIKMKMFNSIRLGAAVLSYLFLIICLYIILHLLKHAPLTWFHYVSYAFPATSLAMMWLLGETSLTLNPKQTKFLCGFTLILYFSCLGIAQSNLFLNVDPTRLGVSLLILLFFLASALVFQWKHRLIKACILFAALSIAPIFFAHPLYHVFTIPSDHQVSNKEWDLYRGSVALQDWISSLPSSMGLVKFWYDEKVQAGNFKSLHSTLLWGHNLLAKMLPGSLKEANRMSMPNLENIAREDVVNTDFIAILSESKQKLMAGKRAIEGILAEQSQIKMIPIINKEYHSKTFNYYMMVLKKEIAKGPLLADLLQVFNKLEHSLGNGNSLGHNTLFVKMKEALLMKTKSKPGHYDAVFPLHKILSDRSKGDKIIIQIKLRVKTGKIGIGILSEQGEQWLSNRIISSTEDPITIDLIGAIDANSKAGYFILYNGETRGHLSEVNLYEIKLYRSGTWNENE